MLADFLEYPFLLLPLASILPFTLQLFCPATHKDTSCVPHLLLGSQEYFTTSYVNICFCLVANVGHGGIPHGTCTGTNSGLFVSSFTGA
jgi:hypothetical protein